MILQIKKEHFDKRNARVLKKEIRQWDEYDWLLRRWKHLDKPNTNGRKIRFKTLTKCRALFRRTA